MDDFVLYFLLQIKDYEKLDTLDERLEEARKIFDNYIMKEVLSCTHVSIYTLSVKRNSSLLQGDAH